MPALGITVSPSLWVYLGHRQPQKLQEEALEGMPSVLNLGHLLLSM